MCTEFGAKLGCSQITSSPKFCRKYANTEDGNCTTRKGKCVDFTECSQAGSKKDCKAASFGCGYDAKMKKCTDVCSEITTGAACNFLAKFDKCTWDKPNKTCNDY